MFFFLFATLIFLILDLFILFFFWTLCWNDKLNFIFFFICSSQAGLCNRNGTIKHKSTPRHSKLHKNKKRKDQHPDQTNCCWWCVGNVSYNDELWNKIITYLMVSVSLTNPINCLHLHHCADKNVIEQHAYYKIFCVFFFFFSDVGSLPWGISLPQKSIVTRPNNTIFQPK